MTNIKSFLKEILNYSYKTENSITVRGESEVIA